MKKAGLWILIIVLLTVILLCFWQWDNIRAIYMGLSYSDEKIESQINKSKEQLAEKLEKEGIVNQNIIDGFSKEDEEKIAKGELTVEEAVEKLFAEENNNSEESSDTSKPNNQTDVNYNKVEEHNKTGKTPVEENHENVNESVSDQETGTVNSNEQNSSVDSKKLIQSAIKEMYTLKATYVQMLAAIEKTAKTMYAQGKKTKERKLEIADELMPQVIEAEKKCDAQVEVILGNLKAGLQEIGADTSVAEVIREQYKKEKQLQKSKYISKYM